MEKTYQEKITTLLTEIGVLKKKSDQVSMYRLLLIIGLLILIYQLFKINETIGGISIIAGIVGFYYLVKYHEKIDSEIELKETTLEVIKNELASLERISGGYYNGQEYARPTHIFTEDLDIFGEGSLFHLINRTKSKAGNDYLAQQLLGENENFTIEEKQEAAREIAVKTDWRLSFFASMFRITNEERGVSRVLKQIEHPPVLNLEKLIEIYSKVLPFLWLATFASAYFVSLSFAGYVVGGLALVNFRLSGMNQKHTEEYFNTVAGAGRLMEKFGVATGLIAQEPWQSIILKNAHARLPISKLNSKNPIDDFVIILKKLDMRRNMLASIFLTLASPFQPIQLIKLRKWLEENPAFFEKIFDVIGQFELYASIGNLSFNKPNWVFPSINSYENFTLHGVEMGHPLINTKHVVCNSFDFDESNRLTLITGSNMSGKSTFLRTVGLNIILAYAGCPVFAQQMKLSKGIKLVCYMRIKDSIQQNASTFKAEIERIKLVLSAINQNENALFLIDEMLRGTNSEDKLAGSMALLEKIVSSKAFAMVATHDLRMTEISEKYPNVVKNYYFEYATENGELLFDYLIKEGVCKSFNASLLLKSIGLPIGNKL
ncbi:DNA mismatch repair protein MutS domain protein [Emticicia oligotrophica DSM 17448]|uniref:DNA mismatch repair protein MutS domain protein n=1 Tax=Emticicia oligotrophica (strain DSM 17448 / CIP 109782 / MTCC 6937 / GPTSA100-15) TaxID=929562 RepID=A0ABN4AIS9_EMTOG|nr:DNA mismatch repair protein MutS domain protein [Emticicia oligotrophica]AFK02011.1 DNA mismatch repair protein MutS domain protein [Emticicia oligotrophica DSM 17448]